MIINNEEESNLWVSLLEARATLFLINAWKKLFLAAVAGAFLSAGVWYLLAPHHATQVLYISKKVSQEKDFDFLRFNRIIRGIAKAASTNLEKNQISVTQLQMYKNMSSEKWWQQHLSIIYGLTKNDVKAFNFNGKSNESHSGVMDGILFSVSGSSKIQASENVQLAAQFWRSGAIYAEVSELIDSNLSYMGGGRQETELKIAKAKMDIAMKLDNLKRLELLYKRFPADASASSRPMISGVSDSKYLPLSAQIIAANIDIEDARSALSLLEKELYSSISFEAFNNRAYQVLQKTFDGRALVEELLELAKKERELNHEREALFNSFLLEFSSNISGIKTLFLSDMQLSSVISINRVALIYWILVGLFIGFTLSLPMLVFSPRDYLKKIFS